MCIYPILAGIAASVGWFENGLQEDRAAPGLSNTVGQDRITLNGILDE